MLTGKALLLAALALVTLAYLAFWALYAARRRREAGLAAGPIHYGIGFVTNFLDTLGIGSFATTTSMYKLWKLVPDQQIPGTLNVGHAANAIAQSFIYITIVEVELQTLMLMILAAVVGSWFGAGVVAGLPRRKVQIGMGFALVAAATVMALTALDLVPGGGTATALEGPRLAVGVAGNMVLGALMTLGIGLYAPCMILVSMLGMNPITAFPIMMGSCAFLMPAAGVRFIRKDRYHLPAAVALTIGGVPAVLIAAFLVRSLPLEYVRWLVVAVVFYTASAMLRSAAAERGADRNAVPAT